MEDYPRDVGPPFQLETLFLVRNVGGPKRD